MYTLLTKIISKILWISSCIFLFVRKSCLSRISDIIFHTSFLKYCRSYYWTTSAIRYSLGIAISRDIKSIEIISLIKMTIFSSTISRILTLDIACSFIRHWFWSYCVFMLEILELCVLYSSFTRFLLKEI